MRIELDQVTKTFGTSVCALRDLSLEIRSGELTVLVGPSGCGKTTALRIIAGLERPSNGRVLLDGRDITHLPAQARDVAMVFQRSALYPHLNVRKNLAFSLRLKQGRLWRSRAQVKEEAQRVKEVATLLHVDTLLDRRPAQLSGGQQQRVSLGRALVRQPGVLLLDEPLSHLDFRLRAELRRELHLLQRRLRGTMLYVTHDPTEALTLGDRAAVLDRGKLLQFDVPAAVYERPNQRRVAEFFGWPPMNLIDGSLANDGTLFRSKSNDLEVFGPLIGSPVGSEAIQPGRRAESRWVTPNGQAIRPLCPVGFGRMASSVTLGMRPEDVCMLPELSRIEQPELVHLGRMSVTLVEDIGAGKLLTLRRGDLQLTALTNQDGNVGQECEVMCNVKRLHWFDGVSGRALAHGETPV
jgi:multiple sugar transport system ATP-binding protein